MVIKSLQQLLEGKPLPEQTLTELEKWAEQYPYHLSPNLIRLLNERFEGPLEYNAHELNRMLEKDEAKWKGSFEKNFPTGPFA